MHLKIRDLPANPAGFTLTHPFLSGFLAIFLLGAVENRRASCWFVFFGVTLIIKKTSDQKRGLEPQPKNFWLMWNPNWNSWAWHQISSSWWTSRFVKIWSTKICGFLQLSAAETWLSNRTTSWAGIKRDIFISSNKSQKYMITWTPREIFWADFWLAGASKCRNGRRGNAVKF